MKKVLAVIGGFFAKIGRWIANTAWVQPLLIVGGIFAIIFSIPYIKQGIEGLQSTDSTSSEIQYYKDRAISLTNAKDHTSDLDKLFSALEGGTEEDISYIKGKYGEKFFLSFGKETCSYCEECVGGFNYFRDNFKDLVTAREGTADIKYNFVTVMLDTVDDDGDYLAKFVFEEHASFFDEVSAEFAEWEEYALLNNVNESQKNTLISSIEKLAKGTDDEGEGLETPTTLLIDLTERGQQVEIHPHFVTEIFFNYVDYLSTAKYPEKTNIYKGNFIADAWTYSKLFEKDWTRNNNA